MYKPRERRTTVWPNGGVGVGGHGNGAHVLAVAAPMYFRAAVSASGMVSSTHYFFSGFPLYPTAAAAAAAVTTSLRSITYTLLYTRNFSALVGRPVTAAVRIVPAL